MLKLFHGCPVWMGQVCGAERKYLAIVAVAFCASLAGGCGASLTADQPQGSFASLDQKSTAGITGSLGAGAGAAASGGATMQVKKAADILTSVATPGTTAYKIGPLDVLDISVFKVPELSKSVQVADTGSVNLPLVGEVPAAGKTAQQVERDLTAKLGAKYLQNPQVTVYVKEYNSQRVTVEGAVKKPGVYPIRGGSSLLQFVATAEGLDPTSDSTVVIFRTVDGKRSAAKFDVSEIRSGQLQDPVIQSGDVIVAGSSAMKETFNNLIKVLPIAGTFALL
jgi:polysaccharide biosynthesis/export protein